MAALTSAELTCYRQHLEAFVIFTDAEWNIFAEHLYRRNIRKREALVAQGQVCHEIGFILSGSFRFFFLKNGVEISNYFCFSGELISAYQSFLKQAPSFPTVEAMEDASLICFSYTSLQALVQNPTMTLKMERFGRLMAEYLICCYEERVVSFVTQSPEERYCELLQKQPDLLQRVPQHYVANYLGITPVSLSRIRKRLATAATPKTLTLVA